jgi:hypothetical protein
LAENRVSEEVADRATDKSGGLIGAIFSGVAKVWNAVTADGHLAAAWRQGIDEIGMALKPFPDSIQVDEPGTLWNPTQGEIANARELSPSGPPHPWPSELAKDLNNQPSNGNGNDSGKDGGFSM